MRVVFSAFALWVAGTIGVFAQDFAPDSMAGSYLTVAITGGSAPFAASGSYLLFTSAAGTNYAVLGRAGTGFGSGTYNYDKTAGTSGVLTFVDSQSGPGISMNLSYTSSTGGTLTLTGSTGSQNGTFTTTNYVAVSPPDMFLPSFTNGQLQTYLGGQEGFVYSIETSSNLTSWSAWTNVELPDLTTNLSANAVVGSRFFRARTAATAFAPDSLTNKTFNLSITDGELPLTTNGVCQWVADANDNGYQIIGGQGTTNSSGTYSYTKTGPNGGVISYSDSLAGNVNEQLVFTSPDSGYFYATNSGGFESGTFNLAEGAVEFMGNISFVPDTARSGDLYFAADGSPASLSVSNAAGWVWMLTFPADALSTPAMITMTPFASADSIDALLPMTEGVQLEPDGLQFEDAVTLTAIPPAALGSHASLMMAGDDGGDIYFVPTTSQAGTYSTTLFHFTSAGATDPSEQAWADFLAKHPASAAEAVYNQASNTMATMDAAAIPVLPPPPDYQFAPCLSTNPADGEVDAYIKSVLTKQTDVLKNLFDAAAVLKFMGTNLDSQSTNLAKALIETTEFPLVDELIGRYAGTDLAKFQPVYKLEANISSQDKLYGGKGNKNWNNELKPWAQAIVDDDLAELRNHRYDMIKASQSMFSTMEKDFGTNAGDEATFQTDLKSAAIFTLSVEITMNGTVSEEAKGDNGTNIITGAKVDGTITDNYESGTAGPATLVLPNPSSKTRA
jgi:hypothetical protein